MAESSSFALVALQFINQTPDFELGRESDCPGELLLHCTVWIYLTKFVMLQPRCGFGNRNLGSIGAQRIAKGKLLALRGM